MSELKDYFELDFLRTANVKFELSAVRGNSKTENQIIAQTHIDFSSHVKFCSFYIPAHFCNNLLNTCKAALSYTRDLLALRGGGTFSLPKADGSWDGQEITLMANNDYLDVGLIPLEGLRLYMVRDFLVASPVYIYAEADLTKKEENEIVEIGKRYNLTVIIRGRKYSMERSKKVIPLAFISHDSRDKDDIARPIAEGLTKIGIPVWFDEYSLKPGDRLRESIEKGMQACKKCIVVLTPNFLNNSGWSAAEFNMIFTREIIEESPLVVPVWAGVSKEDVYRYSPGLLNVLGAIWDKSNEEKVIRDISRSLDD